MRTELEHIDWDMELQNRAKEIDMQWIFIKEKAQEKIENHVPTRKIKMKRMKNKYCLDTETIENIRKKHRVWQRYRESGYLDEDKLKIYQRLRK